MGKRPYYKPSGLGGFFVALLIGILGLIGLFLSNYGFLLIPVFLIFYFYIKKSDNKSTQYNSNSVNKLESQEKNYAWWGNLNDIWKKELNFQIGKPEHNYSGAIGNKIANFISTNGITDRPNIEELNKILSISSLWVSSYEIESFEPLKQLDKLTELQLWRQQLNGIESLRHLKNLTKLNLGIWNSVNDIGPLKDLENLVELDLTNKNISEQQRMELKEYLPNCKIIYD